MHPRTKSSGLICGLALLLAAAPVRAQAREAISPEMQQALRAAKTVRLEVQQDYDFPSAEAEGLAGLTNEALETLTGKAFASGDEWLRWWKENSGKPFVRPPIKVPTEEPHP